MDVSARAREEALSEMRRPSRSMDSLLFCLALARSDGALHWCRLGSEAARSVSPYPGSENGNASDHSAPLPPPGPKKKGRPPKNKSKGAADVFALSCMESLNCYLSAPGNDDGDALSNRKRVRCFCFCFLLRLRITCRLINGAVARFTIILADES